MPRKPKQGTDAAFVAALKARYGPSVVAGCYPVTAPAEERLQWLTDRTDYLWALPKLTDADRISITINSRRKVLLLLALSPQTATTPVQ